MEHIVANYLLIAFLLSGILNILLGRKNNILCCGIFGGSAKEGRKLSQRKLNTLGSINVQRGPDSCGYYWNGNIVKGVNQLKNWSDFIDSNELIPGELNCEVFMGHTRKSTSGAHDENNAHPHTVDNYVQTHNGVIKNVFDLCKEFDQAYVPAEVDSISLAKMIKRHGFKVLHKYVGFAALTMTFKDDPNSLYLYHGASRDNHAHKQLWEERPLFILHQPEGIYYSSIKSSLKVISENKAKPIQVDHNVVIKIVQGVITDFEYRVNRKDNNLPWVYSAPVKPITGMANGYNGSGELPFNKHPTGYKLLTEPAKITTIQPVKSPDPAFKSLILTESVPLERSTQEVYFRRGRFYRGENILLSGHYDIDRKGKIINAGEKSMSLVEKYFFVRGVMLRTAMAYAKLFKKIPDIDTDLNPNFAYYISAYSRYPVTCLETEGLGIHEDIRSKWYMNEMLSSGQFAVKFTNRKYNIKNGILIGVEKAFPQDIIFAATQPINKPDVVDSFNGLMDCIIYDIEDWTDRIIKKSDLADIPEALLVFFDDYVSMLQRTHISQKIIEQETTILLNDLITQRVTFKEYCKAAGDSHGVSRGEIESIFKEYDLEDFCKGINRYEFLDFDVDGGNNKPNIEEAEIINDAPDDVCEFSVGGVNGNKELFIFNKEKKQWVSCKESLDEKIAAKKETLKLETLPFDKAQQEIDYSVTEENLVAIAEEQESKDLICNMLIQSIEMRKLAEKLADLQTCDAAQDMAAISFTAVSDIEQHLAELLKQPAYKEIKNFIN